MAVTARRPANGVARTSSLLAVGGSAEAAAAVAAADAVLLSAPVPAVAGFRPRPEVEFGGETAETEGVTGEDAAEPGVGDDDDPSSMPAARTPTNERRDNKGADST